MQQLFLYLMIGVKLNIVLGVVFEGQPKVLCNTLSITASNLSRWRKDKSISSEELSKFFTYGISLDWLFDKSNLNISDMFNHTPAGIALKNKFFPYEKPPVLSMSLNEPKSNGERLQHVTPFFQRRRTTKKQRIVSIARGVCLLCPYLNKS